MDGKRPGYVPLDPPSGQRFELSPEELERSLDDFISSCAPVDEIFFDSFPPSPFELLLTPVDLGDPEVAAVAGGIDPATGDRVVRTKAAPAAPPLVPAPWESVIDAVELRPLLSVPRDVLFDTTRPFKLVPASWSLSGFWADLQVEWHAYRAERRALNRVTKRAERRARRRNNIVKRRRRQRAGRSR